MIDNYSFEEICMKVSLQNKCLYCRMVTPEVIQLYVYINAILIKYQTQI